MRRNLPAHFYAVAMFTRPTDLPDSVIAEALAVGCGLVVDEVEYAPVGFGSHHWRVGTRNEQWFVTVDDLDARQRQVADSRDVVASRLCAAFGTARALRAHGLEFVVAPQPRPSGTVTYRVSDRYLAAVYEHIDGDTHASGAYESRVDRIAVLDRLVALHASTTAVHDIATLDDFSIPSRDQLAAALADPHSEWGPGPFAGRAKQLLDEHASAVQAAFDRYDDLVVETARTTERFVITHGEPHRANTIDTADGVVLIDWDTALLAPPERDLWMLIDDKLDIAEEYTTRTGVAIDDQAVALYRLWWDLCEIALYIAEFRAPHLDSEDTHTAWDGLCEYLDPQRWRTEE